ncbi:Hsp70 family protein [Nocardia sp. NPDC020380]|uniref:Hsp70 family protein n=1 Tax=Nocardia sp. NPDC020380 TaxID=3364309 RepID=UPI0037AB1E5C
MSQGLALGITVGTSNTVAVTTSGGQRKLHIRPSMLGAEQELPESFLSRVGDPVDIRTRDGSAVRAADLVAAAVGRAVDDTGPAASIVACYPAWWTQHTVEVQRTALTAAGLDSVALVPEPTAAMRWLQEVHESSHDGAMAVYDLGATGLTVSVARTGAMSGLLGEPIHSTTVAGAEFDLLTLRFVLGYAIGEKDFDPFDPLVEQELTALRDRCRNAKETLSKNTATVVPVRLPGSAPVDVRLVRDEVEDLYRESLLASADLVREAVRRAGLTLADLDGVLLTGGGAAMPLVTELISTEIGVPVAAASDPAHLSAHGAALLAADLLADTTPTEAHPALGASGLPQRVKGTPLPQTIHSLRTGSTERYGANRETLGTNRHPITDATARTGSLGTNTAAGEANTGLAGAGADTARVNGRTNNAAAQAGTAGQADSRTPGDKPGTAGRTRALPMLPADEPPSGFTRWRRVVIAGAAVVVLAGLGAGGLALGTSSHTATTKTPAAPTTSVLAPAPNAGTTTAPNAPGATTMPGQPAASVPGVPSTAPIAAQPNNGQSAPPGQPDAGAPQQPAQQPDPGQPAPQQPAQPAAPQLPSVQAPTVPPLPSVPTVQAPNLNLPSVQLLPKSGG